jgi:hypothetical protein
MYGDDDMDEWMVMMMRMDRWMNGENVWMGG